MVSGLKTGLISAVFPVSIGFFEVRLVNYKFGTYECFYT